jgi:hypothetical protein
MTIVGSTFRVGIANTGMRTRFAARVYPHRDVGQATIWKWARGRTGRICCAESTKLARRDAPLPWAHARMWRPTVEHIHDEWEHVRSGPPRDGDVAKGEGTQSRRARRKWDAGEPGKCDDAGQLPSPLRSPATSPGAAGCSRKPTSGRARWSSTGRSRSRG